MMDRCKVCGVELASGEGYECYLCHCKMCSGDRKQAYGYNLCAKCNTQENLFMLKRMANK